MTDTTGISEYRALAVEAAGMQRGSENAAGYAERLSQARYPLLADPHGDELEWLLSHESDRLARLPPLPPQQEWGTEKIFLQGATVDRRYKIGRPVPDKGDCRYITADHWALKDRLEFCMGEGLTLIVTDVGTSLPQALLDVLGRRIIVKGRNMYMNIADQNMDYHTDFRLYLVTSSPTPLLPIEEVEKVMVLNASKHVGIVSIEYSPEAGGTATVVFTQLSGCEVARLPMELSALNYQELIATFAEKVGQQPYSCDLITPDGEVASSLAKVSRSTPTADTLARGVGAISSELEAAAAAA
jgi:hypothetical protein